MCLLGFAGLSCSDAGEDAPAENTATHAEQFSSLAVERVIPLRIVMSTYDCNGPPTGYPNTCCTVPPGNPVPPGGCRACTDSDPNCGPDTATYANVRYGVERANFIMRPLGVQFYVKRIEKYVMPSFWDTSDQTNKYRWDLPGLQDQLRKVFPNLSSSAFDPGDKTLTRLWLPAVTSRFGEPREIIVFVANNSNGFDGRRPWVGASSLVGDGAMFTIPFKLAHELGHILGLEHTMYPEQSRNAEKAPDLVWSDPADYWDLMYGINGSQPKYFQSRSEALAWGGPLYPKSKWGPSNCGMDANCTLTCCINGTMQNGVCTSGWTETIGTPGAKGLGFTFVGDLPYYGMYRRGANSMFYIDQSSACEQWGSFSESQTEQVRRTLRSDVRIYDADETLTQYAAGFTAKRHLLGDYRAQWGFDKLDVDGDGKRDIGVWQPPGTGSAGPSVGQFRVLLSSTNYATVLQKDFGRVGDVPMLADYDGDNRTDLAVLRRGGLTDEDPFDSRMWWVWCKSSVNPANPDCANYGWVQWGYQEDVPLPGLEFDNNLTTREVAVYRPSTTYLYWKTIGQTTWGSVYVRFAQPRLVHLHGLYDADNLTDVVVYEPELARFFMLLSSRGWNPDQAVSRWFDSWLRADAIAASAAGSNAPPIRHGGVPLPAEKNGRRVLRVWDPYTGNWYTNWDPINSTSILPCQWGSPRDVPLAGAIDRDSDGMTDFAVYRPTGNGPAIHMRTNACGSNTYSIWAVPGGTPRSVVGAVPDLKGSDDGKADFVVLDPNRMEWLRYHSQANGTYVQQALLYLGEAGAIPL